MEACAPPTTRPWAALYDASSPKVMFAPQSLIEQERPQRLHSFVPGMVKSFDAWFGNVVGSLPEQAGGELERHTLHLPHNATRDDVACALSLYRDFNLSLVLSYPDSDFPGEALFERMLPAPEETVDYCWLDRDELALIRILAPGAAVLESYPHRHGKAMRTLYLVEILPKPSVAALPAPEPAMPQLDLTVSMPQPVTIEPAPSAPPAPNQLWLVHSSRGAGGQMFGKVYQNYADALGLRADLTAFATAARHLRERYGLTDADLAAVGDAAFVDPVQLT
jgi:hypothetical protein